MTLCIQVEGSVADAYDCLRAINTSGLDSYADVVLIDDGKVASLIDIVGLVQNTRYWRLQPGQSIVGAFNRASLLAGPRYVGLMSSAVRMTNEWLADVRAIFSRSPRCAVVGTKLVAADLTITASGYLPDPGGTLRDFAAARHAADPHGDALEPVVAVGGLAMVVRADAFAALGGFTEAFTDPHEAAVDFCIRCWDRGHSVIYQPTSPLSWHDDGGMIGAGQTRLAAQVNELFARRWAASPKAAWLPAVGRALMLTHASESEADSSKTSRQAVALRALGWDVAIWAVGKRGGDDSAAAESTRRDAYHTLRGMGVHVLRSPFVGSLDAAIGIPAARTTLIHVSQAATVTMALDHLRAAAPDCIILLVVDGDDSAMMADDTFSALVANLQVCDVALISSEFVYSVLVEVMPSKKQRLVAAPAWYDAQALADLYQEKITGLRPALGKRMALAREAADPT